MESKVAEARAAADREPQSDCRASHTAHSALHSPAQSHEQLGSSREQLAALRSETEAELTTLQEFLAAAGLRACSRDIFLAETPSA